MDIFALKLILTFIVGGLWITLGTIIAEKYGTKIGGVIAGLPSTVAVTLFFIGWTQSAQFASQSTAIVPIVTGISGFFVAVYFLLTKKFFFFVNKKYTSTKNPLIPVPMGTMAVDFL